SNSSPLTAGLSKILLSASVSFFIVGCDIERRKIMKTM
ncbi:MAG: hypothetical protein ACI85I_002286, partial [Arenicella sp.]